VKTATRSRTESKPAAGDRPPRPAFTRADAQPGAEEQPRALRALAAPVEPLPPVESIVTDPEHARAEENLRRLSREAAALEAKVDDLEDDLREAREALEPKVVEDAAIQDLVVGMPPVEAGAPAQTREELLRQKGDVAQEHRRLAAARDQQERILSQKLRPRASRQALAHLLPHHAVRMSRVLLAIEVLDRELSGVDEIYDLVERNGLALVDPLTGARELIRAARGQFGELRANLYELRAGAAARGATP
jgi:hypothetical protein